MKILLAIISLALLSGCAFGQEPLKCGPYQHVEHWDSPCGPASCGLGVPCVAICTPPPPDKCVDDLHFVTEAEWQKLMSEVGSKHIETHAASVPNNYEILPIDMPNGEIWFWMPQGTVCDKVQQLWIDESELFRCWRKK
jgi:hypothetical protein